MCSNIDIDNQYQLYGEAVYMISDKYKTFIALEQNKTFTETAEKLYCSQPTVTQHIKQLEIELNCQLINRRKNQVELTEQGKIVLHYAKQVKRLESKMQSDLNESLQEQNTTLYISQYIANYFFCELFDVENMMCKHCPYEINSHCYDDLKQCLLEKKTKFTIMPIYDDHTVLNNFDIDILFEEEFVLVMPQNHPLASRQIIYARDLRNLPILLPQSFYLNQHIKQAIDQKNVTVYYMQMTNFELIVKAIQHQFGVSFLPSKLLEKGLEGLTVKKVKGLTIKRKIGIVYNREQPLSIAEKSFCNHLGKNLKLKSS